MEKIDDSDRNSAMLASEVFNNILDLTRSSNLNFQLQLSPFSAQISLKRTLVKDRSGAIRLPAVQTSQTSRTQHLDIENLKATINKYEKDFFILQNNYTEAVNECEKVHETL